MLQEHEPVVDTAEVQTETAAPAVPEANGTPVAPEVPVDVAAEQPSSAADEPRDGGDWHAEAGRKGALRIHELIERGRLYEKEHGLTSGRQRLRQLIEEGKLYEQEHGLRPEDGEGRRERVRMSQREVLESFLESLVRLAKPGYRPQLLRLLQSLQDESN
jgi:hypothetical protein